jgi:nitroimidazol reductase NimA-like FMN-containing flavoprotein (pyridoxamine 5'-phosphate oxidase superfamily)
VEKTGMLRRLEEVQSFMGRVRLASFATITPRNEPHVVPVFFTYTDGKVYVQTDRKSVKVQNLLRNDNVTIAVYSGEEAVIIKGKGRIIQDDEKFVKRTQEHIDKYRLRLDEEEGTRLEYSYSTREYAVLLKLQANE